ncbi:MAG TPA: hypothetical protein IAC66_04995 [Candidatus Aphodousia gallistercoris]|nr:hypothetical protein [Candidatus Aphodousia gallistercoris]
MNYILVFLLLALGALLASNGLSFLWAAPVAFITALLFSYQGKFSKLAVNKDLSAQERARAMNKLTVLYIVAFVASFAIVLAGYFGFSML